MTIWELLRPSDRGASYAVPALRANLAPRSALRTPIRPGVTSPNSTPLLWVGVFICSKKTVLKRRVHCIQLF